MLDLYRSLQHAQEWSVQDGRQGFLCNGVGLQFHQRFQKGWILNVKVKDGGSWHSFASLPLQRPLDQDAALFDKALLIFQAAFPAETAHTHYRSLQQALITLGAMGQWTLMCKEHKVYLFADQGQPRIPVLPPEMETLVQDSAGYLVPNFTGRCGADYGLWHIDLPLSSHERLALL